MFVCSMSVSPLCFVYKFVYVCVVFELPVRLSRCVFVCRLCLCALLCLFVFKLVFVFVCRVCVVCKCM